jgi:hypothetical protein
MSAQPLFRLNAGFVVIVALIVIGVVADGAVIVTHLRASSTQSQSSSDHQAGQKEEGQHPCNHGFYVSQAAHSKNGGSSAKQVAKGDLGKNGDCSAPLPGAQDPSGTHNTSGEKDD